MFVKMSLSFSLDTTPIFVKNTNVPKVNVTRIQSCLIKIKKERLSVSTFTVFFLSTAVDFGTEPTAGSHPCDCLRPGKPLFKSLVRAYNFLHCCAAVRKQSQEA